jgi:hypothetical protein
MTLLDEYRRSIQSRLASRSNQDQRRRSRQLTPYVVERQMLAH